MGSLCCPLHLVAICIVSGIAIRYAILVQLLEHGQTVLVVALVLLHCSCILIMCEDRELQLVNIVNSFANYCL